MTSNTNTNPNLNFPPSPLILTQPPPLHPSWIAYISSIPPSPPSPSPLSRKYIYRQTSLAQNALVLSTSLTHLTQNLLLTPFSIPSPAGHEIPTRLYTPSHLSHPDSTPIIIYFHGGGLSVGDLDSEDVTCRALALSLRVPLISISYRLLPDFSADDAVSDALTSFTYLCLSFPTQKFILVGSSSGGQLASTVALTNLQEREGRERILGVVLRCPVTCDATDNGTRIPEEWRKEHRSMNEDFYTGILHKAAVTRENRVEEYKMPLEILAGMPKLARATKLEEVSQFAEASNIEEVMTKWFLQLCTNDIYYSDGVCLGLGLKERGYIVRMRVEVGWPHTFWLKGMVLEEAQRAEKELIKGAKWVLSGLGGPGDADTEEAGVQEEQDWVEWSEKVNSKERFWG